MVRRISVGILGATGIVGQQYVRLLAEHPWFEIAFLAASTSSMGKTYGEAILGRKHCPIPESILQLPVHGLEEIEIAKEKCHFVFSALPTEGAMRYEAVYASHDLPVISNASYHRLSADVPILIPEVNPHHAQIIPIQQYNRKWEKGFIVTKPNCSVQSYILPLAPLHAAFRVKKLFVTTLQAVSGAGYPGPSSLEMIDNVIPHIAQEEDKSESEPLKMWGEVRQNAIEPTDSIAISAHCNRVPVMDGHLVCVSVEVKKKPSLDAVIDLWRRFPGLDLPSAPRTPLIYREEVDRPQPRRDRDAGAGMSVTIGRLRPCPLTHYRFVALSHNTIRGAAGGGILNAEFLVNQGYLSCKEIFTSQK